MLGIKFVSKVVGVGDIAKRSLEIGHSIALMGYNDLEGNDSLYVGIDLDVHILNQTFHLWISNST